MVLEAGFDGSELEPETPFVVVLPDDPDDPDDPDEVLPPL